MNGLHSWLCQRLTGIWIACYAVLLSAWWWCHPDVDYALWRTHMSCVYMQILTLLTLVAVGYHAWIGMWTIGSDYIKCRALRFIYDVFVGLVLLLSIVWAIVLLWGVSA